MSSERPEETLTYEEEFKRRVIKSVKKPKEHKKKETVTSNSSYREVIDNLKNACISNPSADQQSSASLTNFSFNNVNVSDYKYEDAYSDDSDREMLDDLEAELLGETGPVRGKGGDGGVSAGEIGRRINLSARTQNEIVNSEKKTEKRVSNQGRDDRATVEQVLDPRTRLILFKLLSNGFLSEIDGMCDVVDVIVVISFFFWHFIFLIIFFFIACCSF